MLIDNNVGVDADNDEEEWLEHFSKFTAVDHVPPNKILYDPQHKNRSKCFANKSKFLIFICKVSKKEENEKKHKIWNWELWQS